MLTARLGREKATKGLSQKLAVAIPAKNGQLIPPIPTVGHQWATTTTVGTLMRTVTRQEVLGATQTPCPRGGKCAMYQNVKIWLQLKIKVNIRYPLN